jgi:hypothetical protein
MSRGIEYIQHYMGPVFFVNKKTVTYSTISRKIESCPNTDCPKHQESVQGMPFYCTECGSKIDRVLCEKKFEDSPSSFTDNFFNQAFLVSNKHINGTDVFMLGDSLFFENDSQQVYVPKFKPTEFTFGIIDSKTFGKQCVNEQCRYQHYYTDVSYKHCPECGASLVINITHDVEGVLSEKEASTLFESYVQDNFDNFMFVDNHEWDYLVNQYSATTACKEIIRNIEKAYGYGCVTMRLAVVSYHRNF